MSDATSVDTAQAPGWEALLQTLDGLYGPQEVQAYGPPPGMGRHTGAYLSSIRAYRRETPVPHWHLVSAGLSDLFEKTSQDPEVSGFGFEMTLRVPLAVGEDDPPSWALNYLNNSARYVHESGNGFRAGHYMNLNGPMTAERPDSLIRSIAFVVDPELPAIHTPNGRVEFLQAVGITQAEEDSLKRWQTVKLMEALQPHLPMWITDLGRGDLSRLPDVAGRVEVGSQADGSSVGFQYFDQLDWAQTKRLLRSPLSTVIVGALGVEVIREMLPLRLPFQRPFSLFGQPRIVSFEPSSANRVEAEGVTLRVFLDEPTMRALVETVKPVAGEYPVPGLETLVIHVLKTEMKDWQGRVLDVVG